MIVVYSFLIFCAVVGLIEFFRETARQQKAEERRKKLEPKQLRNQKNPFGK